ncbi:hypothetical protein AAFF_G00099740 [Aldrovandia affinis]|uniref:Uncharacterized protein n=1 Tax=Aldrovandia affinis TaxID=143900 RepID=A0AAD7RV04_9TELE|nr:hypothetical protein AAFF_G00099740 [Aldrovandia affinis]
MAAAAHLSGRERAGRGFGALGRERRALLSAPWGGGRELEGRLLWGGASSQAEGGGSWDVLTLEGTGGDTRTGEDQDRRKGKGPAALSRVSGRAPAVTNEGPGGLGSRAAAEVAHDPPQAGRAGSEGAGVVDTPGFPKPPPELKSWS